MNNVRESEPTLRRGDADKSGKVIESGGPHTKIPKYDSFNPLTPKPKQ